MWRIKRGRRERREMIENGRKEGESIGRKGGEREMKRERKL